MALGWEIISSGGTAAALRGGGVDVTEVAEVTGAREMLDGRVKTIHPIVHGGILADRSKPEHLADLAAAGAQPIDLVVCNLYPFGKAPSIEMIDIGGPAMVRAAAKNHAHVGAVVDPADYGAVIEELEAGHALSDSLRRCLARKAFAHCASYDAAIVTWLDSGAPEPIGGAEPAPAGAPSFPSDSVAAEELAPAGASSFPGDSVAAEELAPAGAPSFPSDSVAADESAVEGSSAVEGEFCRRGEFCRLRLGSDRGFGARGAAGVAGPAAAAGRGVALRREPGPVGRPLSAG